MLKLQSTIHDVQSGRPSAAIGSASAGSHLILDVLFLGKPPVPEFHSWCQAWF